MRLFVLLRWRAVAGDEPELHRAARAGDVERVRELLASGADPTTPTSFDGSFVRCVADLESVGLEERVALLRLLVVAGVDIDALQPGDSFWPPLCHVAFSGSSRGVEALLMAGANPILDDDPLGRAVWGANDGEGPDTQRKVDLLVAAGCSVDRHDAAGLTPLHGALMPYSHGPGYSSSDGCNVPGAAALIRHGASIDITFGNGVGPLHIVANEGCPQGVELLLAVGAEARARDDEGKTPLDYAVENLDRARKLPTVESYRATFKNDSDADLRGRVARMTQYHQETLIPRADECVRLLQFR